jgi:uncharacterized OB-fold protein
MTPEQRERHRAKARERYHRYRAAGSCHRCGIESVRGTSLCTECGRKNSRRVLERLREKKTTATSGTGPEKEEG